MACFRMHSKPQVLEAVENRSDCREKTRLLRFEQDAQRSRHSQIQDMRVPACQSVVQYHEGVRRLRPDREDLPLPRAQVGDDREQQPARGLPDSNPVERFEGWRSTPRLAPSWSSAATAVGIVMEPYRRRRRSRSPAW